MEVGEESKALRGKLQDLDKCFKRQFETQAKKAVQQNPAAKELQRTCEALQDSLSLLQEHAAMRVDVERAASASIGPLERRLSNLELRHDAELLILRDQTQMLKEKANQLSKELTQTQQWLGETAEARDRTAEK